MFKIAILIISLAMISCGKDEKTEDSVNHTFSDKLIKQYNNISGLNAIHNSEVTCENNICPEAMAQITFASETGQSYGVCSAFLITKDILMTNSHCIPTYLNRSDIDCSKRLSVFFPKNQTKKKSDRVYCKEIIHNDDGQLGLDYAFLKIQRKVDRTPITIENKLGFKRNQIITSWNMTPNQDHAHLGIIKSQKCKVVYSNFLRPKFNHPHYPYVTLGDCIAKPGNSGSPILNQEGNAIGILNIQYKKKYMDKLVSKLNYNFNKGLTRFAGAQNFSCMIFPDALVGNKTKKRSDCNLNEIISGKYNNFFNYLKDQEENSLIDSYKLLKENLQDFTNIIFPSGKNSVLTKSYKWKTTEDGHTHNTKYQTVPTCYNKTQISKREILNIGLTINLPSYEPLDTFNIYGQREFNTYWNDFIIQEYINPPNVQGKNVTYKVKLLRGNDEIYYNEEVAPCL